MDRRERMVTDGRSGGIGGSELAEVVGVVRRPVTEHRPHFAENEMLDFSLQFQIKIRWTKLRKMKSP